MSKYSLTARPRVILKKDKAKPFWYCHPWVFSGAIDKIKGNPEQGEVVEVFDHDNNFIGKGFFNSDSQIRIRLLSWNIHEKIDIDFFRDKIRRAIYLREQILWLADKSNAYRLIHGEGDGLPGLIVDRYDGFLAVQFLSAGMDLRRDILLTVLREETAAETIIERYPARYRELEGLKEIDFLVHGPEPPEKFFIRENGINFQMSLGKGQKTGFYLDQRENRLRLVQYPAHKRVLDAFCYSGAFGIYLLANQKASDVMFMDSSSFALEMLQENLKQNRLSVTSAPQKADIFKILPEMAKSGESFDMIILDPPKVAPDKASLAQGIQSLRTINATAMKMLLTGGMLVTCDCSGIISPGDFCRMLSQAAKQADRNVQMIDSMGAGPDHPVHPACPESSYLKVAICIITGP